MPDGSDHFAVFGGYTISELNEVLRRINIKYVFDGWHFEIPHGVIDDLVGIFLPLLCQVQVDHGGFKVGVAQIALYNADVDACFKQVRGIGVPQSVD